MWRHVFGYAGQQGITADHTLDTASRKAVKIATQIYRFTTTVADKKRAGVVGALFYVLLQPLSSVDAYKNRSVF